MRHFLAAAVEHIPPKNYQTVRYYGLYSNKRRGMDAKAGRPRPRMREAATTLRPPSSQPTLVILPPPSPGSARALRPIWRDLIVKIWGEDPLLCPCCKGTMKVVGTMIRREEVEFFLRLHGLWKGLIALPPPPAPPFDIETMEPLDIPPQWLERRGRAAARRLVAGGRTAWQAPELALDEERILVLDADDPFPPDEWAACAANYR